MLLHQTIEALNRLKLYGMAHAIREQEQDSVCRDLTFEERFGLLVDREVVEQENRHLDSRLRLAKLRQSATFEDIDYKTTRGLNKAVLLELSTCAWIRNHQNLLIIGPTGVGKTYLACGLAHKACREGFSVLYQRMSRMLHELSVARGDGRYLRLIKALAKVELLILDDWGLEIFGKEHRHDLLDLLEERHDRKSTLVTSQVPVENWHSIIGDPTVADSILDRLVHNAHNIDLKGESMRKKMAAILKNKTTT